MNIIKIADITLLIWRGTLKQVSWLRERSQRARGKLQLSVAMEGGHTNRLWPKLVKGNKDEFRFY